MNLKIKDPGSAITHFTAMLLVFVAATPLLMKAAHTLNTIRLLSLSIFIISMVLLYAASTTYHTFDISNRVNQILKKVDHMMIFVLIAGSYTPICLVALGGKVGLSLCILVWGIALAGIILKACWVFCPKWVSSVIYITMGWLCVPAFKAIFHALSSAAFFWLLAGGILYTIGGIIYSLKFPVFNSTHKYFGSHEIFHLFVMGGSACHFVCMYFIAMMPIH